MLVERNIGTPRLFGASRPGERLRQRGEHPQVLRELPRCLPQHFERGAFIATLQLQRGLLQPRLHRTRRKFFPLRDHRQRLVRLQSTAMHGHQTLGVLAGQSAGDFHQLRDHSRRARPLLTRLEKPRPLRTEHQLVRWSAGGQLQRLVGLLGQASCLQKGRQQAAIRDRKRLRLLLQFLDDLFACLCRLNRDQGHPHGLVHRSGVLHMFQTLPRPLHRTRGVFQRGCQLRQQRQKTRLLGKLILSRQQQVQALLELVVRLQRLSRAQHILEPACFDQLLPDAQRLLMRFAAMMKMRQRLLRRCAARMRRHHRRIGRAGLRSQLPGLV